MFTVTARVQRLQSLVEADSFNQNAHYMLGEEYLRDGRAMEAAAKFRRVVELNVDHADAWRMMGESYERAGVAKEAAAAFGTAARQYTQQSNPAQSATMRASADRLSGS